MKIKAIELDGQWVYMQVDDSLEIDTPRAKQPVMRGGFESKGDIEETAHKMVNNLHGVVKAITTTTLKALRESVGANVDKVTLEFGVTLGGEAGIPFVSSGKAEGSIKVTVECSFPQR